MQGLQALLHVLAFFILKKQQQQQLPLKHNLCSLQNIDSHVAVENWQELTKIQVGSLNIISFCKSDEVYCLNTYSSILLHLSWITLF